MLKYKYKIQDSIGGRKEQQDNAGVSVTKFGLLVIVCDGMGGARGGALASKMAVNIISNEITNSIHNQPAAAIIEAFKKANAEIYKRSCNDENCRGMGTTAAVLLLQNEKATLAHVGDSRIYLFRKSDLLPFKYKKTFRTFDHSKVFELVRRGIMNEEQARVSNESNIILRAIGIKPNIDIEVKDNLPYLKGDRFLLCTDGICGAVPEKELLNLLCDKSDISLVLNKLITTIDQIGFNNGGGHDNLTAAIIECKNNSKLKTPLNMKSKIIISSLAVMLVLSLGYIGFSKLSGNSPDEKILQEQKIQNKELEKKVDNLIQEKTFLQDSLIQLNQKKQKSDIHPIGHENSNGETELEKVTKLVAKEEAKKKSEVKKEGNVPAKTAIEKANPKAKALETTGSEKKIESKKEEKEDTKKIDKKNTNPPNEPNDKQ